MEKKADLSARLRKLLAQLGDAIGGSVSGSSDVNDSIRQIHDEGYHLYVVLDAKIGIDRDRRKAYEAAKQSAGGELDSAISSPSHGAAGTARTRRVVVAPESPVEFRMNIGDALFLRTLGIDGTLRIRRARALPPEPFAGAYDAPR